MKEKKHIDDLFKDRFQNFEANPSPHVWENIHAELQKKKKDRKVIPLWWKVGGVAALLALMLTVGNSVFNSNNNTNNSVVTSEESVPSIEDMDSKDQIITEKNKSEKTKVVSEDLDDLLNNEEAFKESSLDNNLDKTLKTADEVYSNSQASKNAVAVQDASVKTSKKSSVTSNKLIETEASEAVSAKDKIVITSRSLSPEAVAEVQNNNDNSDKVKTTSKNNPLIKEGMDVVKPDAVTIASEEKQATETEDLVREKGVSEENKTSILDAINEQEKLKTEDAVAQKDVPEDRWDVAPNFAPVYYSSLSQGSSLDPTFADNSQSGDVNISYGVQVSYNVTNRLSIRSGVSNVDLSYSTGGVELGTGPVASALRTIDYGGKSIVLTAVDQGTFQQQMNQNPDNGFGPITPKANTGEAQINQSIQYYEVPLELKYSLTNTKFGVNVIGGLSTLFLGNNEVSVNSGGFRSSLGEANNLSSVSFSTNIGLGFDYKISRKLKFNVEPMFKYQLNPYTDSSVDFQPYYIGVYTGLSFKF